MAKSGRDSKGILETQEITWKREVGWVIVTVRWLKRCKNINIAKEKKN